MAFTPPRLPLLEVNNIRQAFQPRDAQPICVLDRCSLNLWDHEIVALLGKSGSGKSTLLRIMAGLIEPSAGNVLYRGKPVTGPIPGLGMVFQEPALLPWLNVLDNVQLGLQSKQLPAETCRERALHAIDIVGMDGFESAYPKELSGGMRQRVGLARALVVNPAVLLMDEPFSSLDVLTADNLRNDLLDLWQSKQTAIKSILMVTHNIEEAALMADRILIFGANPGHVHAELDVNLPHPRSDTDDNVRSLIDAIYASLSTSSHGIQHVPLRHRTIDLHYRLPKVDISEITGLLEALHQDYAGRTALSTFSEDMQLDVDDIFQLMEVLEILRLAHIDDQAICLDTIGRAFAEADILERKQIFAQQLLKHVTLARHIRSALDARSDHVLSEERFLTELQDSLTEEAAEDVLKLVIEWGRYAEVFAYHANTHTLSLEDPE